MKYFKNLFLALISLAFVATTIALPVEDGEASEPFDEAKFNEVALKAYNEMVPFEGMYDALMLPEGFDYKPFELQDEESIELRKHFPNASIPIVDPGEHVGIRYTPSVEPDAKSGRADKIVEWHVCETSDASPWWQGIQKNIEYLNSIKNNWCCLEWPSPNGCQLLHRTWRDATDICTTLHSCVRCGWAAQANLDIMINCRKGSVAGGYKRRVVKWASGSESQVEVNVWQMKTFFNKH